jgi:hypothetical protein
MSGIATRKIVRISRADLDHPDYAHRLAACTAWNALLLLDRIRLDEELEDLAAERAAHPDQEFVSDDDVLDMLEEENDDLVSVEGLTVEDIETTGAGQAPVPPDGDEARSDLDPAAAPVPARTGKKAARRQRAADIRAWAQENGIPVTGTGRFPRALVDAYDAAHPGGAG